MNVRAFYNMISIVSFQKLQIDRNKKKTWETSHSIVAYVSCVAEPPQFLTGWQARFFLSGWVLAEGVFVHGGFWHRGFLSKGGFGRGVFLAEGGFV